MSVDADQGDEGRRINAALVLTGRTVDDVAPELNISARTLSRVISGQRQARDWEIRRLAELLPVPEWFLREGFSAQPSIDELRERDLVEIRARLDELPSRLLEVLSRPEFRRVLREVLAESARADTAGRRRQLERDEPA